VPGAVAEAFKGVVRAHTVLWQGFLNGVLTGLGGGVGSGDGVGILSELWRVLCQVSGC